ncbi:MAG: hypothetical protein HDS00_05235 [Bacteroides sp.]|nr:hypothetical protein [Bacteroides sp.]
MHPIIKLIKSNDKFTIIDVFGNVIVNNIIEAKEGTCFWRNPNIQLITTNHEYSEINIFGFFFNKFHYSEYKFVSKIAIDFEIYKFSHKTSKKYSIGTYRNHTDYIYDEIIPLDSNNFSGIDIIKVRIGKKYSLLRFPINKYIESKQYDYIFTPIQPLNEFIVLKSGKFGLIDAFTFEEIITPRFNSIDLLCNFSGYNKAKHTFDIFQTDKTIKIERTVDKKHYRSYFIDKSKQNKTQWGGCDISIYDYRFDITYVQSLSSPYSNDRIPINLYGYFYNLFDCRKYDVVINMIGKYYITKKNSKFGLIDDEFKEYLSLEYSKIELVSLRNIEKQPIFVVSHKKGVFLFNPETGLRTKEFEGLYDCTLRYHFNDFIVFKEKGKFGKMSPNGNILLPAIFSIPTEDPTSNVFGEISFQEYFHKRKHIFYVTDNKFYGEVSLTDYDLCLKVGYSFRYFYIIKKDGKYGLLNKSLKEIIPPIFDDIIDSDSQEISIFSSDGYHWEEEYARHQILIGCINNTFNIYYLSGMNPGQTIRELITGCTKIEFVADKSYYRSNNIRNKMFIHFVKGDINGYVNYDGEVLSLNPTDSISPVNCKFNGEIYYIIKQNNKVRLADSRLRLLLPCAYDDIIQIFEDRVIVLVDNDRKTIPLRNSNDKINSSNIEFDDEYETESTYDLYAGSYAQDIMDYSDEDIDDIFDGEPDAYWNID